MSRPSYSKTAPGFCLQFHIQTPTHSGSDAFKRQEPVNTLQAAATYSMTIWRQSTFIAMRRQKMSSFGSVLISRVASLALRGASGRNATRPTQIPTPIGLFGQQGSVDQPQRDADGLKFKSSFGIFVRAGAGIRIFPPAWPKPGAKTQKSKGDRGFCKFRRPAFRRGEGPPFYGEHQTFCRAAAQT